MKGNNEIKSTAHSKYRCQYHLVFAPKYRRKEVYGKIRHRRNLKKTMQPKRRRNHWGGGMPRPYTYASKHTTVYKYSTVYGISQRKK